MIRADGAPIEIERKFLVRSEGFRGGARAVSIRQGYLARTEEIVVRVRLADELATLTIKGKPTGITTPEFEYAIPREHAISLLALCGEATIEKTRYSVRHLDHVWEVDVFAGANDGLMLAEIELETEAETFSIPDWLGPEVTHDARFKNARLCIEPYRDDWVTHGREERA